MSGEAAVRRTLDAMASPAARKRWIMDLHAAGGMDDDQVSFWFYVYALHGA